MDIQSLSLQQTIMTDSVQFCELTHLNEVKDQLKRIIRWKLILAAVDIQDEIMLLVTVIHRFRG